MKDLPDYSRGTRHLVFFMYFFIPYCLVCPVWSLKFFCLLFLMSKCNIFDFRALFLKRGLQGVNVLHQCFTVTGCWARQRKCH